MTQPIKISKPTHFSFSECLWFLDRNYDDCLHEVGEKAVRKLAEIEGIPTLLEITEEDNSLIINILAVIHEKDSLLNENVTEKWKGVDFVREWFDLDRDIEPFYKLLAKDSALNHMPALYSGLRLLGIPDLFEALCWSIIGQQINLAFAFKLKRKFTEMFGTKLTYENQDYWLFPKPEVVANLTPEMLRPWQFSQRKAEYLIEIARHFAEGKISKEMLETQTTAEAINTLTKIRGIGEWTANYALMKSLKRLECITYGDVGLYNALAALKGLPKRPSKEELANFFKDFEQWEAYTVFYLWRSLTTKPLTS